MKQAILFFITTLLFSCYWGDEHKQAFTLNGAWTLSQVEYPFGHVDSFPMDGITYLRFYEGDTAMYQCRLIRSASAWVIQPTMVCNVKVVDKGNNERLYLEESDPHPLTIQNDTTILIQQNGVLYTWHKAEELGNEWGTEICDIIRGDTRKNNTNEVHSYVLSAKERQQKNVILWLTWFTVTIIIIVLAVAQNAVANRRKKRKLKFQLQQIKELQENRPKMVRQAVETMEQAFFVSDDYIALQRRIASGQHLKEQDWADIERMMKRVYPGFSSQLRSLYPLSELEYQVCMLVKLRFPPTDIANVLARSISTISTMRSRLYIKVFGQKGGAKEWDDFLLTIGV